MAELPCPRCGETQRMEVRFRYGPAGHRRLSLGERIEWTPGVARLDGPSSEPVLEVPAIASCGACAKLAARFARREWRMLKKGCEGDEEAASRAGASSRARGGDDRIDALLAFLDYGFTFRESRELGREVISRPGRYIERLGELVLGHSPVTFDRWVGALRIERDRLAAVRLLPLAVQDAMRAFPVSVHFGALSASVARLFPLVERHGEAWLVRALFRVALRLEVGGWWQMLASAEDGRLEFAAKLESLLEQLPWADASLAALARSTGSAPTTRSRARSTRPSRASPRLVRGTIRGHCSSTSRAP
ncbi:MAG: hypothetical protein IPK07_34875 [Deltaproteobacteria bacterium]|nr:hypothetical protein [Deltaproteobacteria bacterium]